MRTTKIVRARRKRTPMGSASETANIIEQEKGANHSMLARGRTNNF